MWWLTATDNSSSEVSDALLASMDTRLACDAKTYVGKTLVHVKRLNTNFGIIAQSPKDSSFILIFAK